MKKEKDKPMLMDALSRLSNSDTNEKPKQSSKILGNPYEIYSYVI